ncbi:MAG: SLBB domain-containing protein [Treponema sp.]|nr:SLBB domain-containing protein [Treponema sp.]
MASSRTSGNASKTSVDATKAMSKNDLTGVNENIQLIADPQLAMSVPNYPVTAGDVYTLAFAAGTTPVTYSIAVDSTYKIRVANLGVLNVRGLTYNQLKAQVDALVSRNYPMGGMQFVLTSPAVFLVSISGEVKTAMEKKAWALTRLSSFVTASLTDYSSTRQVTVVSDTGESKDYDLYKAQNDGDFSQDPYLRPGDKIVITRIDRKVMINGAVERPGTYEILTGENLKDLIEMYGHGLTPLADTSRIELYRTLTGSAGAGEKSYLSKAQIDENFPLLCYDEVTIGSYADLSPTVVVEGAVWENPDTMEKSTAETSNRIIAAFNSGEDYAYFVRRNRNWFTAVSDVSNAYIIREKKIIPIDLSLMLYDASYYANVTMQEHDTLIVPFRQYFVTVAGAVTSPGRFPYIPDRGFEYYVGLAGGFDRTKNKRKSVDILTFDGQKLGKKDTILPETTITANVNSGLYYFNQYAPVLTTLLSILATSLSAWAVINSQ